jgi:hypothetical protein
VRSTYESTRLALAVTATTLASDSWRVDQGDVRIIGRMTVGGSFDGDNCVQRIHNVERERVFDIRRGASLSISLRSISVSTYATSISARLISKWIERWATTSRRRLKSIGKDYATPVEGD